MNLDSFLQAYIVCALWSSVEIDEDGNGEPLDDNYDADDISPELLANMREDCADFIASNADDLAAYDEQMSGEQWSGSERAGHDFWLTRNGHGCGFWDRGLGELGDRLSKAAKVYGSVDIGPNADGKLYA